ncbi:MAG TPA: hypothetical protein VNN18_02345 [Candidatus Xenobia bacterium]|nr:hypothetical protein [Candidatus Xenobia bacterium]
MRRTRFMTLLFLALSVAFFFVKEFRWGLCSQSFLFLMDGEGSPAQRLGQVCLASEDEFSALGQAAEQSGDAAALAFAALHPGPGGKDSAARWADQAVAKDLQYTWVYYHMANSRLSDARQPEAVRQIGQWVEKLTAWDPENAAAWLLRAELLRQSATQWPKRTTHIKPDSPYLQELGKRTDWTAAMERAFLAPRYDAYVQKRFDLERKVLPERGWASPSVMLLFVATYPIPSLLNIREYADLRVAYFGAKVEEAGRLDEALSHYRTVAAFGKRMRLGGKTLIEELIGIAVEKTASERLLAVLLKTNRRDEATQVELNRMELARATTRARGEDPLALTSMYSWSALLVVVSGLLVLVFGVLTGVCVGYVNLKQWIRREKRGRLYRLMTVAENYLPVLLFLSCAGLFLVYRPYATNFQHYMTATGETSNFELFFFNVFPNPLILSRANYLGVENPFGTYLWWALGFGLLAVIIASVQEWHARQAKAS